ncbi:MAG TPA: glycosyltransferase [Saprospiraceae bacterium]|nr:glycosyltransferase [Saprospiraceae bacterium]
MRVVFTVTNDLTYDQRMHRICGALAANGYTVTLVGRWLPTSVPLDDKPYEQIRFRLPFRKGFAFYAIYNIRIFLYLLFARYDAVCSIDLDSLPAGCLATLIRGKKRVFDAHEYFTEVPEVVNRPLVKNFWALVAKIFLPFYRHAYTVGPGLAALFHKIYGLEFSVVRNVPNYLPKPPKVEPTDKKILLYQGALNEGRGIETLLEAMQQLPDFQLVLAGEGDLSQKLRQMSESLQVQDRVLFLGFVKPDALKTWTQKAWLSLNLLENKGLSYYYSLANKFFDAVQAGVPVLTMDFPEYHALNQEFEVAVLLPELHVDLVVTAIRDLTQNEKWYACMSENCIQAAKVWNWEQDEKILLELWERVGEGN